MRAAASESHDRMWFWSMLNAADTHNSNPTDSNVGGKPPAVAAYDDTKNKYFKVVAKAEHPQIFGRDIYVKRIDRKHKGIDPARGGCGMVTIMRTI